MKPLDQFARRELWVSWAIAKRKGKPTKVPFAIDGKEAKSDDASTWMTRAQAARCARERQHQGIGIMFAALDEGRHLGGIDLDACIDDGGDVAPWAREILDLVPSYTEVSPSGRGLKIYFEHDPRETLDAAKDWRRGVRRKATDGGKDHGIEMYFEHRYFAVTGRTFEDRDTVAMVTLDRLQAVHVKMEAFQPRPAPKPAADHPHRYENDDDRLFAAIDHIANQDLHWEEWNRIGMAIYAATGGSAEGRAAFLAFSAKGTVDDPAYSNWKWDQYHRSPPKRLGAGTLFHEAKANGWREPARERKANGDDRPAPPSSDAAEPVSDGEPDMAAFDIETTRLAKLTTLAYAQQRGDTAKRFKVPVAFIDKAVTALRNPTKADDLPTIVPWHEEVDGPALLNEIAAVILRHVRVPTRGEDAVALWILFAHCFDAADIAPRLAVTSPMPECGKTTLLELIESMVPRPLLASNVTAAAVFRAIDKWTPTLIIDEADTFLPENDDLRGVLNSGHKRAGAYTMRTVGDDHDARRFSTWCPMAIALIGSLPHTLAGRSIHIELQRLLRTERVERYRSAKKPYDILARKAARWAGDNLNALRDADPEISPEFWNRRADNWKPLLAIADRAGGDWPMRAREAALTIDPAGLQQDKATELLADTRQILGDRRSIPSKELAETLGAMEGRPWAEWGRTRKPITTHAVARLFKGLKLGIAPRDVREGDNNFKGYLATDFVEAFSRYLPPVEV